VCPAYSCIPACFVASSDPTDAVVSGDVLPPNLVQLEAADVLAVECLLPLAQLELLTIYNARVGSLSAEALLELSCLTALTAVELCYHDDPADASYAAAGWGALPVLSLDLAFTSVETLMDDVVQQLATCSNLTRLCVKCNVQSSAKVRAVPVLLPQAHCSCAALIA